MKISFKGYIPKTIAPIYKTKQSKSDTIAILGSSKTTDKILNYMDMCSNSVKSMILSGKNIVHGCCTAGIMGSAYSAGKEYSKQNEAGKPVQNLAIVANPLWGDEDLENCIPITIVNSEAERIQKFTEVADTILIFPGGAGTIQEASSLIFKNYYGKEEEKRKIVLVGREFFKGLTTQYDKLCEAGLIKCKPNELYTVVDSEEEIKNNVLK